MPRPRVSPFFSVRGLFTGVVRRQRAIAISSHFTSSQCTSIQYSRITTIPSRRTACQRSIMAFSPVVWWKRDTALNTYIYAQLLISLPFSVFGTYVTYQMQIAGFMIGDDGAGGPCTTYCIIEWAGSRLDLNAILLYMNAFGVGLGGLVTLILSAYSDYWCKFKLKPQACSTLGTDNCGVQLKSTSW